MFSFEIGEGFLWSFWYKTPPVAAYVVFAENDVIFSVITITLGYNQKLSWKYCNYHHSSLYKNIHLLSKVRPSDPNICSLFRQIPNFMTLPIIYNFNISIFLRGDGVSHSNTVHLIVSLSKIDCPSTKRTNLLLSKKCSWNYSLFIKIYLKFIMSIKTSAIQSFKGL